MQAMLHERFMANMRRIREDRGLTQRELGERMDVSAPYIAELEAGRHTPSLKLAERVAEALGITTETLLGRIPEKIAG
jgi:putative transcriptional regulator